MKNNCCLFERIFKIQEKSVFLFGISFFVLAILTFLYYANLRSDDVVHCTTKGLCNNYQEGGQQNERGAQCKLTALGRGGNM